MARLDSDLTPVGVLEFGELPDCLTLHLAQNSLAPALGPKRKHEPAPVNDLVVELIGAIAYFLIALPMAAIFIASLINVGLPRGVPATAAITGSLLSGVTSFNALLGAHWSGV